MQKQTTIWTAGSLGALVALSFTNVMFLLLALPIHERVLDEVYEVKGHPIPTLTLFISSHSTLIIAANFVYAALCIFWSTRRGRYILFASSLGATLNLFQLLITAVALFWLPLPLPCTGLSDLVP
jgi:hypothetical protein